MPTPTFTPGDEQQNEKNIGQENSDQLFNSMSEMEKRGTATPDTSSGSSSAEEFASKKEAEGESSAGWKNNYNNEQSEYGGKKSALLGRDVSASNLRAVLKKRGPLGLILLILGVGGIGLGSLFSGGSLLINMAETLKGNIMDSSATVLNANSKKLLAAKINDISSGVCNNVTPIRCKFKTMSERQIARFEKAGITVIKSDSIIPGRSGVKGLEFEGKEISARTVKAEMRSNPKLATALNKAFNPRFYAWSSSAAAKWYGRAGITKNTSLTSSSDKEKMKASLQEAMKGREAAAIKAGLIDTNTVDDNGDKIFKDGDGNSYSGEEADKKLADSDPVYKKALEDKKTAADAGDSVGKSTSAALKGTLLVGTGLIDSACTGWTILRTAAFAAKYLGAIQMIRYANVFLTTADAIKAGEATPEEVAFLGDIITSTNSAGVSGMNSRGWNYAAYGDTSEVPNLGDNATLNGDYLSSDSADNEVLKGEVTNYINGQITAEGPMAELANAAASGGGGTAAADETCGFVKSTAGQAIIIGVGVVALTGCVVGIILAGAGAGCLGANALGSATLSTTIAVTTSLLSPYLIGLATDTLISGDENGNQAMNAVVSGAGAMDSQMSLATGGGYLTTTDAEQFNITKSETNAEFAAIDSDELNPLDATNPNTFVGKFVSSVAPYVSKSGAISSGISSISSIAKNSFASLLPSAGAKSYGNANVCPDEDYKTAGIATDINCNPIVGQSQKTLNADVDEVLNFMETGGYINEDGTAKTDAADSKYNNYIKYCVERSSAFGSYEDGGDGRTDDTTGNNCIEGKDPAYDMFRAYQSLSIANEGMDGDYEFENAGSARSSSDPTPQVGEAGTVNDYDNGCTPGGGVVCDGQCVDFVKFRLKKHINQDEFASLGMNGPGADTCTGGGGADVAFALNRDYGYELNSTPAVHAVVSWRPGQGNVTHGCGHVALVAAVYADGSILVEQSNGNGPVYGTEVIPADIARQLQYAHTEVDYK